MAEEDFSLWTVFSAVLGKAASSLPPYFFRAALLSTKRMWSPSDTQSKFKISLSFSSILWSFRKKAEPKSPFSSLSKKTNSTFFRSSSGIRSISSQSVMTPEVLSLAVCLLGIPAKNTSTISPMIRRNDAQ